MKKSAESEHQLKLAIRDIVVRNPLVSVAALQRSLLDRGFKTTNGNPLDWYYVAKVVRKDGWPRFQIGIAGCPTLVGFEGGCFPVTEVMTNAN
jgi:hypothetical protein